MSTSALISLYVMAGMYIFAGICHFWKPKIFLSITPKWVPKPAIVNIVVGIIEIILGIGVLFETTRMYAAIGIMMLLIVIFPANVYHYQKAKRKGKFVIQTLIRLPIQAPLLYWAYTFI
ncbi:MauE/DoxX family redox-associated membrane protein [uncultured Kordia sp.]|uniref:DoxX family protein n=1 Tax=uncultured Kordia sp. TaxID=507699 RepID=UPI0026205778|nr:MauE/DoxX family redox-associated membrane protein [uncultured Kordia sp.]